MPWGMRGQITLLATLVVLLVLTAMAFALVGSQRSVLTDSVDEVLERQSAAIATQLDAGTLPLAGALVGQGDDEAFAEVLDDAGRSIAATQNVPGAVAAPTLKPPVGGAAVFDTVRLPADGQEFRVLSRREGDQLVRVGTPTDDINESVATLARGMAVAVPSVSLLLAGVVWLLVGRVLRPVERIRAQVAEISGTSLHRRVPEPRSRDEVAGLSRTMNAMLERLESASARQRRFVSDASHELRSPLARIRAELEVDLAHPATADLEVTHRSVLEETETLRRLVDDLLTLARLDGDVAVGRRDPVDLDDVLLGEVMHLSGGGRARVDVTGVSGAQVLGDRMQLARAIRNGLDNSVEHGGSFVEVTLREEGTAAVVTVTDNGPGIPEGFHERIFERFARVDEARAAAQGGAGLGLAIAREIIEAHGGTIAVDADHFPGARFVLTIPRSVEGSDVETAANRHALP